MSVGRRKGADQVNVNVGKMAVGNRNGDRRRTDMCVDLRLLTRDTFPSPPIDISGLGMPDKT